MARPRRTHVRRELKNTAYEIFIGILSVLSIINLVLVYVFAADEAIELVLWVMNALFSVIFLGDFIYRIATAESASRYFFRQFGWADLLASLPFPQLKILRVFRLIRVYSLMGAVGPRTIWNTLIRDRANSALMTLLLMGILVMQFGSLSILWVEEGEEGANIETASDALWYTIVTISTVGYGDQYPVTNAGRLIGGLIIIVGVGIFGTFTGYLANLFLGPKVEEAAATTADAASKGVAAGAASGAVAAGSDAADAAAGSDAADSAPPSPAGTVDPETAARLRDLLAQSEQTMAEIRELLGTAGR